MIIFLSHIKKFMILEQELKYNGRLVGKEDILLFKLFLVFNRNNVKRDEILSRHFRQSGIKIDII